MKRLAPFPGFPGAEQRAQRTHWDALSRAIVFQQLAGKAASTIHGRVCALTEGAHFPRCAEFLALDDRALRGAGLSRNKVLALRDLAQRIEDGRLALQRLSRVDDDTIIERLVEVRGIGEWSAQMFLLFRLGRLDVGAAGDLGVQEGLRILDAAPERPTAREALARMEVWRPLRSVGCWAMWRLVDEERAALAARTTKQAPRRSKPVTNLRQSSTKPARRRP
ncbi:MAG: DNA-3-methyladenine glycosylase 2 family protein [Planctomycetes bacterium]|nr:DNA-3-methyladenine glycosylase 2 family protein [Planctomycetota bacterium]